MAHAIVCAFIWLLTIILIPFRRIAELRAAVAVSIVWMIFVDNVSCILGYYRYEQNLIPIGRADLIQLIGISGIGVLMMNFLREKAVSKLMTVITVASAFMVVQYAFSRLGAFSYGSFDVVLSFVHSVAALSIFLWLASAVVGERKLYADRKTRDALRKPAC